MIKKILKVFTLNHSKCHNLMHKNQYECSGAIRIFKETDQLSQTQIDDILGNQTSVPIKQQKDNLQEIVKRELFYGLVATKNQHFPPCIDPEFVELLETPNQNIMNAINMTVESSFKDYCNGLEFFWKEDQLYGSVSPQTKIAPQSLEFRSLLTTDSPYLQNIRKQFVVNLSMPGSIQAQDPRNFMTLRPVEQFRNTPIIPIAESTMQKHKAKLQEYHRRQMVLQISKESIFNFLFFTTAIGICIYMIFMILQKQEQRTVAYTRLKYNRRMGIKQDRPTFKI